MPRGMVPRLRAQQAHRHFSTGARIITVLLVPVFLSAAAFWSIVIACYSHPALEFKEMYQSLGIPPQNVTAVEYYARQAEHLHQKQRCIQQD